MGETINKMLEENYSADKLKESLYQIFEGYEPERKKKVRKIIEDMDENQVKKFVASMDKGIPIATPVFDGARESEIKSLLSMAGLPTTGQTQLFDGRTGDPFGFPRGAGGLRRSTQRR
jgi:DNA-directed RNA polymerase subunit beta